MTDSASSSKILEPTFYFERKRIIPPASETGAKVFVSELVQAGDKLIDFPDYSKFKEKGYEKTPVHAGSNISFNKDSGDFSAAITGFPRIDMLRLAGESEPTMILSVQPLLDISQDKMSAKFCVHPPLEDANSLVGKNVAELVQELGVVHGLDMDMIARAQAFVDAGCEDFEEFVIAEGLEPGEGTDAWLDFHITIGPIAGEILEDGSIDFRERRIMVGVKNGDHIATKIPPKPGTPGKNILGEEVEPLGGLDFEIKLTQDVKFNPENGHVTATADGVLSVVKGREITVCTNQVIEGDVDYETGNVESTNCISIVGDVQPGFKVKTGGDLEIGGGVMSAQISSMANIVVRGGITGKKATIDALGDVDINFIEQGRLTAGGNIVVRKQSYYSKLVSGGNIFLKDGCKLIGESLVAGGSISVGDVGSENSEPITLAAGIDHLRLEEYYQLKKQLVEQQDEIIQWLQRYGGSKRSKKIRGMEAEVDSTKLKLLQLNLIPGTGKYSRGGGEDTVPGSTREDYSDRGGLAIGQITIDVHGKIFAGSTLMIGNRLLKLDKTLSKRQFKLASNLKRIIAAPIKRRR